MPYKDPQKQRDAAKRWYYANLQKSKENMRKRKAANPGYDKRWAAANPGYSRRWRQAHPEIYDDKHLRRFYGISLVQFKILNGAQGGQCKICGGPPTGKMKRLCVDHCHISGNIRGLLCRACNSLLGHAKDNPEILKKAIAYLAATC